MMITKELLIQARDALDKAGLREPVSRGGREVDPMIASLQAAIDAPEPEPVMLGRANLDELRKERERALSTKILSPTWVKAAQRIMDAFPSLYETAKNVNVELADLTKKLELARLGEFAGQAGMNHLSVLVDELCGEMSKPVAVVDSGLPGGIGWTEEGCDLEDGQELYIRPAPATLPVMTITIEDGVWLHNTPLAAGQLPDGEHKLYAGAVGRDPLTRDQIDDCMKAARQKVGDGRDLEYHFAREVEAAIGVPAKPLTFASIEECFPDGGGTNEYGEVIVSAQWLHDFARAIEAAHNIK